MKARPKFLLRLLIAVTSLLSLAGCNLLPQAQTDPTRFYVLSTTATPVAASPTAKGPAVHLRPIELPNYIKSKPIIVRRGDNEVEFREYARWGEPLERGIGRVLREELIARGAAGAVYTTGLRPSGVDYTYELSVRVLACEGAAGGDVLFHAAWELSTTGKTPTVAARGDFRAADLKWDTKSEASLTSRLSEAVAGLAAEIAAGLTKAGS